MRSIQKKVFRFLIISTTVIAGMGIISGISASYSWAAYDENYIGDMETYTAVYEDTLVHLARKNDLGFVEMRAANPNLDPWIPGEGAEVILPKRHLLPETEREGIVINLPEMRIYAYLNGDSAPYTYPIGVGREGLGTPTGQTSIVRKKEGPIWHPTERMREEDPELAASVLPGPDNPMGTHALYLGWPTYAMHGTNRPFGIGRRVSSGCIRLYPEDIAMLVNDFLLQHFPRIMDYKFTAHIEEELDDIANGKMDWHKMLDEFYHPFNEKVEHTLENSERVTTTFSQGVY